MKIETWSKLIKEAQEMTKPYGKYMDDNQKLDNQEELPTILSEFAKDTDMEKVVIRVNGNPTESTVTADGILEIKMVAEGYKEMPTKDLNDLKGVKVINFDDQETVVKSLYIEPVEENKYAFIYLYVKEQGDKIRKTDRYLKMQLKEPVQGKMDYQTTNFLFEFLNHELRQNDLGNAILKKLGRENFTPEDYNRILHDETNGKPFNAVLEVHLGRKYLGDTLEKLQPKAKSTSDDLVSKLNEILQSSEIPLFKQLIVELSTENPQVYTKRDHGDDGDDSYELVLRLAISYIKA